MSVQVQGSITLKIDDKPFTLKGNVGDIIDVGFRAKNGDDPIVFPKFGIIIPKVAMALGVANTDFQSTFDTKVKELENIPALGYVAKKLLDASLEITDLAITAVYNDTDKKYKVTNAAVGIRVTFDKFLIGPVEVEGFGVLFEYQVPDETPTQSNERRKGVGKLTQRT